MEIDAQKIIDELLEQNKQQTLQIAMLKAVISRLQDQAQPGQAQPAIEKK